MTADPTTTPAMQAEGRPPSAVSPLRRFALAALLLTLLAGICAPFFIDPIARDAPQARGGQVDFTRWGPLTAPVELKGDWRLVWRSAPAPGASLILPVPGAWAGRHPGGPTLPELGAASYQLKLRGLPAGHDTLYIRQGFHARRVLIDGRVMSQVGRYAVATGKAVDAHRARGARGARGARVPRKRARAPQRDRTRRRPRRWGRNSPGASARVE